MTINKPTPRFFRPDDLSIVKTNSVKALKGNGGEYPGSLYLMLMVYQIEVAFRQIRPSDGGR